MTTSHALKFNAAPYDSNGDLVHPDDTSITRGPGRAKCACGELSPELENGAQRRQWFKAHKASPEPVVEVVEEPEPEPEPVVEVVEEAAEQPELVATVSRVLPFKKTKDLAAHFWRYLGRDGSRRLASSGILGNVELTTNAQDHTLRISGTSEEDVEAAIETIKEYWAEAVETGKEWKKTDPAWLARPRGGLAMRQASFHMMGEYYRGYADTFISARQA